MYTAQKIVKYVTKDEFAQMISSTFTPPLSIGLFTTLYLSSKVAPSIFANILFIRIFCVAAPTAFVIKSYETWFMESMGDSLWKLLQPRSLA